MRAALRRTFWTLAILAGLLAAALVTPFLIPLKGYIPELTRLVSERIGEPVSITGLRLQLLPTPRMRIFGLKLGRRGEVSIERASIVPELLPLLSGEKVVRVIFADKVRIKDSALALLDRLSKDGGGERVLVRRIVLRRVMLEHRSLKLPQFNVTVDLGPTPSATVAHISSDDGAFNATLSPEGRGRSRLTVKARRWRIPVAAAPLDFEALEASGVLGGDRLDLRQVHGKLYGGTLEGSVSTRWGRQWRVEGEARIDGVQMVPLQAALGRPARLSGRLSARARYSARARTARRLRGALVLDAPFEVAGGEWHGVDLSRAAELPLGKMAKGGTTRFETFKGDLALRGEHIDVTAICVRSPSLTASGTLAVAPDKTLSGRLDVSVAKTGGFVGAPLALSGTTSDPSLSLTRAAAIGALIGTVLLPGIGTSLGLSAGGRLDGTTRCK